jgi:hypothetical protein
VDNREFEMREEDFGIAHRNTLTGNNKEEI